VTIKKIRLVSILGLAVFLTVSVTTSALAGTGIGNGGDIFSHYVESSRFALKESIRRLMANPHDSTELCESETELDGQQRTDCRFFILQTMRQMIEMNLNQPMPAFLLRDEPLLVEGADGRMREVDARTQLGPLGDIELNYLRVKFYSPFQMLTLVTHEFGHKVLFEGRSVEDNQPTLSFATGRMLLDSVGRAMATYAQQRGVIGSYFKLLDHFSCQVRASAGSTPMGSSGFTGRNFANLQDFGRYETGIGIFPGNLDVFLIEPGFSEIHFKATIHEENSCSTTEASSRWTRLSLVRTYPSQMGRPTPPDEVLAEQTIDQWNPLCGDISVRKPMQLGYGGYLFECVYNGSTGSSSAN
jgi:hypothetical protein